MIRYHAHLDEQYEKKRMIMGILHLILLPEKPQ